MHQGKNKEAEPLLQKVLTVKERTDGPDNPEVASILTSLANIYKADTKYDQAEPLYQRAMDIKMRALGPDHPDLAPTLEAYADLLARTYREAEAEHMKACAKGILSRT
jgi:tetratricopeptide (TPR) repeat protein